VHADKHDDAAASGEETVNLDAAIKFVLAEYGTVRDEWRDSRTAQQQTFAWTLAGVAVVIAATFNASVRSEQPFLYVLAGVIVATYGLASFGIWFGEVSRMERAALYLRGLERDVGKLDVRVGGREPLVFERFRASRPSSDSPWVPKSSSLVVGALCIYGALPLLGLTILVDAAAVSNASTAGIRTLAWVLVVPVAVIYLTGMTYFAVAAWSVYKTSSVVPGPFRSAERRPTEQLTELE